MSALWSWSVWRAFTALVAFILYDFHLYLWIMCYCLCYCSHREKFDIIIATVAGALLLEDKLTMLSVSMKSYILCWSKFDLCLLYYLPGLQTLASQQLTTAAWRKTVHSIFPLPYDMHDFSLLLLLNMLAFDEICKRPACFIYSCLLQCSSLTICHHT